MASSLQRLCDALEGHARRYPGERPGRQPVHTVYGGADRFRADTARKLGDIALRTMDLWMPTGAAMRGRLQGSWRESIAETLHARVRDKLTREPVEDYRIDFEDGYGVRPDTEEDGHARSAAGEVARGMAGGTLPPFVGIRVKALTADSHARALRTLDVFLTALAEATGGRVPPWFVVTLPKVALAAQVETLVDAVEALERALGIPPGAVGIELMVELPTALVAEDGTVALPRLVDAARGRCAAVHLGAYDLTAACGITTVNQSLDHPYCKLARQTMKLALAGRGVWLVDGATTKLPIPPHRAAADAPWTPEQQERNADVVADALGASRRNIENALRDGFYQGWDLHPGQLPVRYAVVYAFFLAQAASEGERLDRFVAQAARATQSGGVFDDAATGQGMVNFFLRAMACGALTEAEVTAHTGLTAEALATRSFARMTESARSQLPR